MNRVREADLVLAIGARLGEATTEGYTVPPLAAPDRKLVHVHPDADELNSVYPADLAICASMDEFAESAALWDEGAVIDFEAGAQAHAEWEEWATAHPNDHALDMGQAVQFMRDTLPADTIICNGAGNFSGWWHRYWRYEGFPTQLAPTCGAMGYGVPAAVAAALRHPERTVVAVAGDGDFLMNGQELATAAQHGADLIVIVVDNSAYGTIRMHQEREFPGEERISGTPARQSRFRRAGAQPMAHGRRTPPLPSNSRKRLSLRRDAAAFASSIAPSISSSLQPVEQVSAGYAPARPQSFQGGVRFPPWSR